MRGWESLPIIFQLASTLISPVVCRIARRKIKKLFISFLVINHSCIRRWEKNHFSSPRLVLNPPLITIYLMFVSPCRQSLEYSSGKSASPDPPESFSGEKNHRNLTTQFFLCVLHLFAFRSEFLICWDARRLNVDVKSMAKVSAFGIC